MATTTFGGGGSGHSSNTCASPMSTLHSPSFLQRAEAARRQIREVDATAVKSLVADGATLIDVREADEFQAGHIPGALNVPGSSLIQQAPSVLPDPSHPVVLVCAGGNRSAIAALELQSLGYRAVSSLAGGLRHWPQALARMASAGR